MIDTLYKLMDSELPSKNRLRNWLYCAQPGLKEFSSNKNTGKWCIFKSVEEIDDAWEKVKVLAQESKILVAKTSTSISSGTERFPNYVICIYSLDCTNMDEVMRIRECLRGVGFTEPLKYKRDIDTITGVYGDGEFLIDESKNGV